MRFSILIFLILLVFPIIAMSQGKPPLTDDYLDSLTISEELGIITQIEAGKTLKFNLHILNPTLSWRETQVAWSVEPKTGVNIDSVSGLLNVAENVPNGVVYTVTANVENGRRLLTEKVYVFNRGVNPFAGKWRGKLPTSACGQKVIRNYQEPIHELGIYVDGTFRAVWFGFERVAGFWGKYSYNLKKRTISFEVTDRSERFKDFKDVGGNGAFKFINNQLLLNNIWFTQWGWSFFNKGKKQPSDCNLIFERS